MVDPTAKDTKDIKNQSTDTEGYLEGKGKVNQLDVGSKKTNTTVVVTIQGQVKTARTKPDDQQLEQVIIITAHQEQLHSNNKTK